MLMSSVCHINISISLSIEDFNFSVIQWMYIAKYHFEKSNDFFNLLTFSS